MDNEKKVLSERFMNFIYKAFEQRILDFNENAALQYAEVMGHRKEIGRPMSVPDGQIAAIARSIKFNLATRNVRDFDKCGLTVVNPFNYIP